MRRRKSSLNQIVKATGFSSATVSRSLNEETASMVKGPTSEKILRAAAKFEYIPDRAARSLRRQRTNTFGFLINFETDTISGYVHEVLNGILDGLKTTDYDLKIVAPSCHAVLDGIIRTHGLDGLILPYGMGHIFKDFARQTELYKDRPWPVVVINDYNPRHYVNQLYSDNLRASRYLSDHLINKGYKDFFLIGCADDSPDVSARKKGFLDIMKERRLRFDPDRDVAHGHFLEIDGYKAMVKLLNERPGYRGAVYCVNDDMALGALRAVGEAKLNCPKDIAVVGFDGISRGEFSNPPLTTVKFELHEMGKEAVKVLTDILSDRQKSFIKKEFPFRILDRQSC